MERLALNSQSQGPLFIVTKVRRQGRVDASRYVTDGVWWNPLKGNPLRRQQEK